MKIGLTLLTNASMPLKFWNYRTSNRPPIPTLNSLTPVEVSLRSHLSISSSKYLVALVFETTKSLDNINYNFDLLDAFFLEIA